MTPRLRYRKDWDWEPNDEITQPTEVDGQEPSSEEAPPVGQSWLSNAAVIASLPDARLRGAIAHHRAMLLTMETELRARGLTGRGPVEIYRPSMFDLTNQTGRSRSDVYPQRRAGARRRTGPAKTSQVTLTPRQMLDALAALMKLKGGT